jgi:hypothetical protein
MLIEEEKIVERVPKKRRIAVSDDEVDEKIAPIPSPKAKPPKSPKSPRKQSPKSVKSVEKEAVSQGEESDSVSADDEPDPKTKKKVAQKLYFPKFPVTAFHFTQHSLSPYFLFLVICFKSVSL